MLLKEHLKYLKLIDPGTMSKRTQRIVKMRLQGMTLREIGEATRYSGSYIGMLLDKEIYRYFRECYEEQKVTS